MVASNMPHNVVLNVTPSMASRWLEGNTHNRSINNGHVERLAREMKAGRWHLTHQGIAFSPSGRLLDGQHRLWAIVMSDVAVPMRVFFNESPQAIETYDGGLSRSTSDRMSLGGRFAHEIDHRHLATLRCMVRGFHPIQRLSYGDEADLLGRHLDAICFSMKHLTTTERARGVATAITKAVIARAYYGVDHAKLIQFCKVLRTGLATSASDEPIIMLRDHLVQSEKSRNSLSVIREQYGKTERALKAYLLGERFVKLCAVTTELFPLPEEVHN